MRIGLKYQEFCRKMVPDSVLLYTCCFWINITAAYICMMNVSAVDVEF